jgi:hypothetical protein
MTKRSRSLCVTPLIFAVLEDSPARKGKIVARLVSAGVDIGLRCKDGLTALDVAKKLGKEKLLPYLEAQLARQRAAAVGAASLAREQAEAAEREAQEARARVAALQREIDETKAILAEETRSLPICGDDMLDVAQELRERAGELTPAEKVVRRFGLCFVCGAGTILSCTDCRMRYYDTPEHQLQDWPRHKPECRAFQELRAGGLSFTESIEKLFESPIRRATSTRNEDDDE